MNHPLAASIPLPFTIPLWLVLAGLVIWVIAQLYTLFVTKPRERREAKLRDRNF